MPPPNALEAPPLKILDQDVQFIETVLNLYRANTGLESTRMARWVIISKMEGHVFFLE